MIDDGSFGEVRIWRVVSLGVFFFSFLFRPVVDSASHMFCHRVEGFGIMIVDDEIS